MTLAVALLDFAAVADESDAGAFALGGSITAEEEDEEDFGMIGWRKEMKKVRKKKRF